MDGLLPVWKPVGLSSYDVIRQWKKFHPNTPSCKRDKVGHAGTLDPFAEGVLILMIGKGTKKFDEIQNWPKTYRATAMLGMSSDTLDSTGKITRQETVREIEGVKISEIKEILYKFTGQIKQIIPQYSAAKYHGKPLYSYARRGEAAPEKSKEITIYSIKVIGKAKNSVEFVTSCSSGTYIRQLSYDIFQSLKIESYLLALTREKIGNIGKEQCVTLPEISQEDMVAQKLLPVPYE